MLRFLTKHLYLARQTYLQHFFSALRYAAISVLAAVIFIIHAMLPFLFEKTGSSLLKKQIIDSINKK